MSFNQTCLTKYNTSVFCVLEGQSVLIYYITEKMLAYCSAFAEIASLFAIFLLNYMSFEAILNTIFPLCLLQNTLVKRKLKIGKSFLNQSCLPCLQ